MNTRKTNVIVKLQVDGIHCWPAAKEVFPEADGPAIIIILNLFSFFFSKTNRK